MFDIDIRFSKTCLVYLFLVWSRTIWVRIFLQLEVAHRGGRGHRGRGHSHQQQHASGRCR